MSCRPCSGLAQAQVAQIPGAEHAARLSRHCLRGPSKRLRRTAAVLSVLS